MRIARIPADMGLTFAFGFMWTNEVCGLCFWKWALVLWGDEE